jgi:hypothetical protein
LKIVNFWGGPGSGKSTTAAAVFYEMKKRQLQVELVTEYAKDMTWEGRHNVLEDQLYILAKQNRRLHRLKGKVDWVITDSPLPLGLIYMIPNYYETFEPFVLDVWNSYSNHSFLLGRDFEYQPVGRNQTAQEALVVDDALVKFLDDKAIDYHRVSNDPQFDRTQQILDHLGLNIRS